MTRTYKAVILVGGPQKGTRFRPLSLECPKPLFPVAGFPTIQHHIDQLSEVNGLKEVLLIGFYQPSDLQPFVQRIQRERPAIHFRYLQEFTPLGTAGGIYHFRDQLLVGAPDAIFVINADVCGDLPLPEMAEAADHMANMCCMVLTTEATRDQSLNYGCVVIDAANQQVLHYVEKPSTFISTNISCGIYLITPEIIEHLAMAFRKRADHFQSNDEMQLDDVETLWFERDIFPQLAATGSFYAYHSTRWWSQIKTAASAIYANRHCLALYREKQPDRLYTAPNVIGDVYVHPSAVVDPTAKENSCVLCSIIGWNSVVGQWSRVEGTPIGPNPNMPFAKMENKPLFKRDGRLNPAITILGCGVHVPKESIILNSIVLPHKELTGSCKNQIIL